MKGQFVGLAALLVACSPKKEVQEPIIPEIKLPEQIRVETEPQPQEEKEKSSNEYSNLGEECSQITLEYGSYPVRMKGWDAKYDVKIWDSRKDCYLSLSTSNISAEIADNGCDNTTDSIRIAELLYKDFSISLRLERAELESLGYQKYFDRLLEEGQQFVCPENKRRLQEYLLKKVLESGNK